MEMVNKEFNLVLWLDIKIFYAVKMEVHITLKLALSDTTFSDGIIILAISSYQRMEKKKKEVSNKVFKFKN